MAVLGAVVGALCVYGGIRLALQGAWGWGLVVALSGGTMLYRTGVMVVASRVSREARQTGEPRSRGDAHTHVSNRPIE
ncbi:MAG: hypothetical protein ACHQ52_13680 [Candidatus Eisenbacteria bacterium]